MTNEDCVCLDGGWLLFENGSLVERRAEGYAGMTREPPTDPHELAKLKCLYWKTKLTLAVEEFDARKKQLLNTAQNSLSESQSTGRCPGPPLTEQEAVALLSELRQKVKRCARELKKWENERATTEPQEARRARDLTEQNRARLNSFCQAVGKIEI